MFRSKSLLSCKHAALISSNAKSKTTSWTEKFNRENKYLFGDLVESQEQRRKRLVLEKVNTKNNDISLLDKEIYVRSCDFEKRRSLFHAGRCLITHSDRIDNNTLNDEFSTIKQSNSDHFIKAISKTSSIFDKVQKGLRTGADVEVRFVNKHKTPELCSTFHHSLLNTSDASCQHVLNPNSLTHQCRSLDVPSTRPVLPQSVITSKNITFHSNRPDQVNGNKVKTHNTKSCDSFFCKNNTLDSVSHGVYDIGNRYEYKFTKGLEFVKCGALMSFHTNSKNCQSKSSDFNNCQCDSDKTKNKLSEKKYTLNAVNEDHSVTYLNNKISVYNCKMECKDDKYKDLSTIKSGNTNKQLYLQHHVKEQILNKNRSNLTVNEENHCNFNVCKENANSNKCNSPPNLKHNIDDNGKYVYESDRKISLKSSNKCSNFDIKNEISDVHKSFSNDAVLHVEDFNLNSYEVKNTNKNVSISKTDNKLDKRYPLELSNTSNTIQTPITNSKHEFDEIEKPPGKPINESNRHNELSCDDFNLLKSQKSPLESNYQNDVSNVKQNVTHRQAIENVVSEKSLMKNFDGCLGIDVSGKLCNIDNDIKKISPDGFLDCSDRNDLKGQSTVSLHNSATTSAKSTNKTKKNIIKNQNFFYVVMPVSKSKKVDKLNKNQLFAILKKVEKKNKLSNSDTNIKYSEISCNKEKVANICDQKNKSLDFITVSLETDVGLIKNKLKNVSKPINEGLLNEKLLISPEFNLIPIDNNVNYDVHRKNFNENLHSKFVSSKTQFCNDHTFLPHSISPKCLTGKLNSENIFQKVVKKKLSDGSSDSVANKAEHVKLIDHGNPYIKDVHSKNIYSNHPVKFSSYLAQGKRDLKKEYDWIKDRNKYETLYSYPRLKVTPFRWCTNFSRKIHKTGERFVKPFSRNEKSKFSKLLNYYTKRDDKGTKKKKKMSSYKKNMFTNKYSHSTDLSFDMRQKNFQPMRKKVPFDNFFRNRKIVASNQVKPKTRNVSFLHEVPGHKEKKAGKISGVIKKRNRSTSGGFFKPHHSDSAAVYYGKNQIRKPSSSFQVKKNKSSKKAEMLLNSIYLTKISPISKGNNYASTLKFSNKHWEKVARPSYSFSGKPDWQLGSSTMSVKPVKTSSKLKNQDFYTPSYNYKNFIQKPTYKNSELHNRMTSNRIGNFGKTDVRNKSSPTFKFVESNFAIVPRSGSNKIISSKRSDIVTKELFSKSQSRLKVENKTVIPTKMRQLLGTASKNLIDGKERTTSLVFRDQLKKYSNSYERKEPMKKSDQDHDDSIVKNFPEYKRDTYVSEIFKKANKGPQNTKKSFSLALDSSSNSANENGPSRTEVAVLSISKPKRPKSSNNLLRSDSLLELHTSKKMNPFLNNNPASKSQIRKETAGSMDKNHTSTESLKNSGGYKNKSFSAFSVNKSTEIRTIVESNEKSVISLFINKNKYNKEDPETYMDKPNYIPKKSQSKKSVSLEKKSHVATLERNINMNDPSSNKRVKSVPLNTTNLFTEYIEDINHHSSDLHKTLQNNENSNPKPDYLNRSDLYVKETNASYFNQNNAEKFPDSNLNVKKLQPVRDFTGLKGNDFSRQHKMSKSSDDNLEKNKFIDFSNTNYDPNQLKNKYTLDSEQTNQDAVLPTHGVIKPKNQQHLIYKKENNTITTSNSKLKKLKYNSDFHYRNKNNENVMGLESETNLSNLTAIEKPSIGEADSRRESDNSFIDGNVLEPPSGADVSDFTQRDRSLNYERDDINDKKSSDSKSPSKNIIVTKVKSPSKIPKMITHWTPKFKDTHNNRLERNSEMISKINKNSDGGSIRLAKGHSVSILRDHDKPKLKPIVNDATSIIHYQYRIQPVGMKPSSSNKAEQMEQEKAIVPKNDSEIKSSTVILDKIQEMGKIFLTTVPDDDVCLSGILEKTDSHNKNQNIYYAKSDKASKKEGSENIDKEVHQLVSKNYNESYSYGSLNKQTNGDEVIKKNKSVAFVPEKKFGFGADSSKKKEEYYNNYKESKSKRDSDDCIYNTSYKQKSVTIMKRDIDPNHLETRSHLNTNYSESDGVKCIREQNKPKTRLFDLIRYSEEKIRNKKISKNEKVNPSPFEKDWNRKETLSKNHCQSCDNPDQMKTLKQKSLKSIDVDHSEKQVDFSSMAGDGFKIKSSKFNDHLCFDNFYEQKMSSVMNNTNEDSIKQVGFHNENIPTFDHTTSETKNKYTKDYIQLPEKTLNQNLTNTDHDTHGEELIKENQKTCLNYLKLEAIESKVKLTDKPDTFNSKIVKRIDNFENDISTETTCNASMNYIKPDSENTVNSPFVSKPKVAENIYETSYLKNTGPLKNTKQDSTANIIHETEMATTRSTENRRNLQCLNKTEDTNDAKSSIENTHLCSTDFKKESSVGSCKLQDFEKSVACNIPEKVCATESYKKVTFSSEKNNFNNNNTLKDVHKDVKNLNAHLDILSHFKNRNVDENIGDVNQSSVSFNSNIMKETDRVSVLTITDRPTDSINSVTPDHVKSSEKEPNDVNKNAATVVLTKFNTDDSGVIKHKLSTLLFDMKKTNLSNKVAENADKLCKTNVLNVFDTSSVNKDSLFNKKLEKDDKISRISVLNNKKTAVLDSFDNDSKKKFFDPLLNVLNKVIVDKQQLAMETCKSITIDTEKALVKSSMSLIGIVNDQTNVIDMAKEEPLLNLVTISKEASTAEKDPIIDRSSSQYATFSETALSSKEKLIKSSVNNTPQLSGMIKSTRLSELPLSSSQSQFKPVNETITHLPQVNENCTLMKNSLTGFAFGLYDTEYNINNKENFSSADNLKKYLHPKYFKAVSGEVLLENKNDASLIMDKITNLDSQNKANSLFKHVENNANNINNTIQFTNKQCQSELKKKKSDKSMTECTDMLFKIVQENKELKVENKYSKTMREDNLQFSGDSDFKIKIKEKCKKLNQSNESIFMTRTAPKDVDNVVNEHKNYVEKPVIISDFNRLVKPVPETVSLTGKSEVKNNENISGFKIKDKKKIKFEKYFSDRVVKPDYETGSFTRNSVVKTIENISAIKDEENKKFEKDFCESIEMLNRLNGFPNYEDRLRAIKNELTEIYSKRKEVLVSKSMSPSKSSRKSTVLDVKRTSNSPDFSSEFKNKNDRLDLNNKGYTISNSNEKPELNVANKNSAANKLVDLTRPKDNSLPRIFKNNNDKNKLSSKGVGILFDTMIRVNRNNSKNKNKYENDHYGIKHDVECVAASVDEETESKPDSKVFNSHYDKNNFINKKKTQQNDIQKEYLERVDNSSFVQNKHLTPYKYEMIASNEEESSYNLEDEEIEEETFDGLPDHQNIISLYYDEVSKRIKFLTPVGESVLQTDDKNNVKCRRKLTSQVDNLEECSHEEYSSDLNEIKTVPSSDKFDSWGKKMEKSSTDFIDDSVRDEPDIKNLETAIKKSCKAMFQLKKFVLKKNEINDKKFNYLSKPFALCDMKSSDLKHFVPTYPHPKNVKTLSDKLCHNKNKVDNKYGSMTVYLKKIVKRSGDSSDIDSVVLKISAKEHSKKYLEDKEKVLLQKQYECLSSNNLSRMILSQKMHDGSLPYCTTNNLEIRKHSVKLNFGTLSLVLQPNRIITEPIVPFKSLKIMVDDSNFDEFENEYLEMEKKNAPEITEIQGLIKCPIKFNPHAQFFGSMPFLKNRMIKNNLYFQNSSGRYDYSTFLPLQKETTNIDSSISFTGYACKKNINHDDIFISELSKFYDNRKSHFPHLNSTPCAPHPQTPSTKHPCVENNNSKMCVKNYLCAPFFQDSSSSMSSNENPVKQSSYDLNLSIPLDEVTDFPLINESKLKLKYHFKDVINIDYIHTWNNPKSMHIPSVTKILNDTMSDHSRAMLERWKNKMIAQLGEEGFELLNKATLKQGADFHDCVKRYLLGTPTGELEVIEPKVDLLIKSIQSVLEKITDVSVVESHVVHPNLTYKGYVDCVALYDGKPTLIEWKHSDKKKPYISRTYDAPIQMSAYLGALNYDENYKLPVKNGMVIVAHTDGSPADVFWLTNDRCNHYWKMWLARLHQFLESRISL